MFVKKRKIKTLVIGGAGYIGSNLIPLLINSGRYVTVLGRSRNPLYALPVDTQYVVGDFSNTELITRLLDVHKEVVQLAYATVPNTSFTNPLQDLLQNLPPTVKLFSAAAKSGSIVLFVSSGGTVYGEAIETPISESHPTHPISPYGVTKLTLENYASLYAVTHGLKFVCVRPSNAYGVGQRPYVGQGFVSTAMASAIVGNPILIFGENGTIRDYIYVSDLAAGIVCALEDGHLFNTYNLGSGIGYCNSDIVAAFSPLLQQSGYDVRTEHLPKRLFDVKVNILDSSKLSLHTGWQRKVSLLEGLNMTYNWLKRSKYE